MTDPLRSLVSAILWQACKDAAGREYTQSARNWLMSEQSEWVTDYLDMTNSVRNWVMAGCPKPNGRMYRKDKVSDRDWSKYYER